MHRGGILRAIDPGDAETDGGRANVAVANRGIHHVMQDFLDLELAGRLQVGAAAARFADDPSLLIGEQAHRFCPACVYAEHVHAPKIVVQSASLPHER